LKELEDYDWFPKIFRRYQTDYIGYVVARFNIYGPFINYLKNQGPLPVEMHDLCSGSGEPAISIFKKSGLFSALTLSDKYPVQNFSSEKSIRYIGESMDALKEPFRKGKLYTIFNAFHHFSDTEKQKITTNIIASDAKAYFVEILSPSLFTLIKILLATTLGTLLLTPFVRPFSWKRMFFTYLLPVNIFTIAYDGIISVMKSLSVSKYRKLFNLQAEKVKVFKIQKGLSSLIVIQVN
jgi:hypothetical protein